MTRTCSRCGQVWSEPPAGDLWHMCQHRWTQWGALAKRVLGILRVRRGSMCGCDSRATTLDAIGQRIGEKVGVPMTVVRLQDSGCVEAKSGRPTSV